MSGIAEKLSNLFKSKQQKELEAKMEFQRNRRSFEKYYDDLGGTIKKFKKTMQDAELSGNHANAVSCAKFVLKLQNTQTKVQGLLQRFEMMKAMQDLTGVYVKFVDACGKMGVAMGSNINLQAVWKSNASMDQAISKLDAMSDNMNMVFKTIDEGLADSSADSDLVNVDDEAALKLINQELGITNTINQPEAKAEQPVQLKKTPAAEEADPDLAKLNDMLKNL